LQLDPLLSELRTAPAFDKLLTAAKECQKPLYCIENGVHVDRRLAEPKEWGTKQQPKLFAYSTGLLVF